MIRNRLQKILSVGFNTSWILVSFFFFLIFINDANSLKTSKLIFADDTILPSCM